MRYVTTIDEVGYNVEIIDERHVILDGVGYEVNFSQVGDQPVYSLIVDGESYNAHVYLEEDTWQILFRGTLYSAQVEDEREKRLRSALGGGPADHVEFHLKAPMPGLVVSVPVGDGQEVEKGDVLLVLESMKMQNELKSPCSGKVSRIRVVTGDNVEQKETLLSVE
jgi:biotin carboxyl carrier protein